MDLVVVGHRGNGSHDPAFCSPSVVRVLAGASYFYSTHPRCSRRRYHPSQIGHAGEICLVIEASLTPWQLWCGLSAHERAIEVFSRQRVWDTENNSGLLIYLLLADRAVEIVADRGLCKKEISRAWPDLLGTLREALSAGQFEAGCLGAIDTAGQLMRQYFPTAEPGKNELPNDVEWL